MSRGFTLVEILVTMAIVAILGTMLVAIFSSTLRGSNKSQILAVIKQNGQAVLDNMDKTVRDADNIVCLSANGDTLVVVQKGIYTRYKFVAPSTTANGLLQQDAPVQPTPPASPIPISSFVASACTDPLVSPVTLTDTNTSSGVSVSSGLFLRSRQSGFKDSVTISFTLDNGINAPEVIAGQIDPVEFKTTIGLR